MRISVTVNIYLLSILGNKMVLIHDCEKDTRKGLRRSTKIRTFKKMNTCIIIYLFFWGVWRYFTVRISVVVLLSVVHVYLMRSHALGVCLLL